MASIGANSSAHVLSIVAGMPSDPLAFFVSSSLSILRTPGAATLIGAMLGNDDGDVPSVGMGSVSWVKTEINC